jgi:hypothetical protein
VPLPAAVRRFRERQFQRLALAVVVGRRPYADYNNSGQPSAGISRSGFSGVAYGFSTNLAYSTAGGSDTAVFYDSPGNDTFYSYTSYNNSDQHLAGMYGGYGGGYVNSASGFATMIANSTNGGNDTADLVGSSGKNALYTDAAIAAIYGNNCTEEAVGFKVVNATGAAGGVNTKGHGVVKYQLNYLGSWLAGS